MSNQTFQLNKTLIKAAFNKAHTSYDEAAVLQREVANRLNERLDFIKLQPQTILEIGSGTGYYTQLLKQRYPNANIICLDIAHAMLASSRKKQSWLHKLRKKQHWLCADAEQLPLAANSVDMIVSNLTLQWCPQLQQTFNGIYNTLKPEGLFMFTTFGPDTLKELRASWRKVDDYNHVNAFLDMHDVGDTLLKAHFSDPVMDVENIVLTYQEVMQLMRELKAIGAHNVTFGRQRGLTGKNKLNKLFNAYEAFRTEGRLPCTYEVVYGHAWKAAQHKDNNSPNENFIPVSAIQRKKPS